MSADTPEGRAVEQIELLRSISEVLDRWYGCAPGGRNVLAQMIANNLPSTCDFDCDSCRE